MGILNRKFIPRGEDEISGRQQFRRKPQTVPKEPYIDESLYDWYRPIFSLVREEEFYAIKEYYSYEKKVAVKLQVRTTSGSIVKYLPRNEVSDQEFDAISSKTIIDATIRTGYNKDTGKFSGTNKWIKLFFSDGTYFEPSGEKLPWEYDKRAVFNDAYYMHYGKWPNTYISECVWLEEEKEGSGVYYVKDDFRRRDRDMADEADEQRFFKSMADDISDARDDDGNFLYDPF